MDTDKLKRMMRMTAVIMIICIANCMRIFNNTNLRAVEIISLIALGMSIGALIVNTRLYFASKKGV